MLALPLYVKVHELQLTEEGLELTVQTLGDRRIRVEGITLQHRNWMEETHLLKTDVIDLENHYYRLRVDYPNKWSGGVILFIYALMTMAAGNGYFDGGASDSKKLSHLSLV